MSAMFTGEKNKNAQEKLSLMGPGYAEGRQMKVQITRTSMTLLCPTNRCMAE
jgi:hypothetical protein